VIGFVQFANTIKKNSTSWGLMIIYVVKLLFICFLVT
jgi:hypothetical protein